MSIECHRLINVSLLALLFSLIAYAANSAPLSPQALYGKDIYLHGDSRTGTKVTATTASGSVPASLFPCAGCHGRDGLGKSEGGIEPSNITWSTLTKPYGHRHPQGRSHGPFSPKTLKVAITRGLDPAGNRLDPAMPRYAMNERDLSALIAYLKRLETELDPGVSDETVRLGIVLSENQYESNGMASKQLLTAYFDRLNRQGGIYNRHIEPIFLDSDRKMDVSLIQREQIFALLSQTDTVDQVDLSELAAKAEIPLIVFSTQELSRPDAGNPYAFYLLGGLKIEALALLDHLLRQAPTDVSGQGLILFGSNPRTSQLAMQLASEKALNSYKIDILPYDGIAADNFKDINATLTSKNYSWVLYLATPEGFDDLLKSVQASSRFPALLLPATLTSPAMLEALKQRPMASLKLAHQGISRADSTTIADTLYSVLRVPPTFIQKLAWVSAFVAEAGLRQSGRRLTREGFVTALENTKNLATGLLPPIGFGRGKHLGVAGAYVLELDRDAQPRMDSMTWIDVGQRQ